MELFFFLLICGIIGSIIGKKKGGAVSSFFLGFLLGPIGIIIVLVVKGNQINCPFCKKLIHKDATKCPYCQSEITNLYRMQKK